MVQGDTCMQDRYAGDIGDYGKNALLKSVENAGLRLGVNWYKSKTAEIEKNADGRYLISEAQKSYDPELARKLLAISTSENRSIEALQNAKLLETACYYDCYVPPKAERDDWQKNAMAVFSSCDIVYLDPDNGLSVKSVRAQSKRSSKYVYMDEIEDYIRCGKSVILYNHRQRIKEDIYFSSVISRFNETQAITGKRIYAITFPKCTIRDYFIISASFEHSQKIEQALSALLSSSFGENGFCKCRPIERKA